VANEIAKSPMDSRSRDRSRGDWRVVVWVGLALVLAGALAVGASHRSGPSTPAERAASLDSQLRCPSCDDVSVADSSAASAVAIRQLVLADTKAGVPDQAIVAYLQSRYPGIVLRPSASGLEGIVWFAPLVAFAVAVVAIGRLFWRKRSRPLEVRVKDEDRLLVAEALKAAGGGPGFARDKVPAIPGKEDNHAAVTDSKSGVRL
jgi:cytochrome c-type biogenesis protein CcmH/NrfF